jgi:hypothetical protein
VNRTLVPADQGLMWQKLSICCGRDAKEGGMSSQPVAQQEGFKKMQIADTVAFALKNIPSVDERTLQAFLELVNVTGTFGIITVEQIVNRFRQVLKYVPDACPRTLMILADLLELKLSAPTVRFTVPSRHQSLPHRPGSAIPAAEQPEPVPAVVNGHHNTL